jgi:hypothetical protein
MDSLMDNCSFLKKDLDGPALTGHLYVFKYLVKKHGGAVKTDKVCVRGADPKDAKGKARELLVKEYGERVDIVFSKWIELEG